MVTLASPPPKRRFPRHGPSRVSTGTAGCAVCSIAATLPPRRLALADGNAELITTATERVRRDHDDARAARQRYLDPDAVPVRLLNS